MIVSIKGVLMGKYIQTKEYEGKEKLRNVFDIYDGRSNEMVRVFVKDTTFKIDRKIHSEIELNCKITTFAKDSKAYVSVVEI